MKKIDTIIRNAAKARASSPQELDELVSLFGETWAKCEAEHKPGPRSLESLAYDRMEQDYINYLRDNARHPAGMTHVGGSPVSVVSLEDDVGEDENGETLTYHDITAYPSDATPEGYADPATEAELGPARAYAYAPRTSPQQTCTREAAQYNAPKRDRDSWIMALADKDPRFPRAPIERAVDAMLALTKTDAKSKRATYDQRARVKAWREDAFAKGAGARPLDPLLPRAIAKKLPIEKLTDPETGGSDGKGWPDYKPTGRLAGASDWRRPWGNEWLVDLEEKRPRGRKRRTIAEIAEGNWFAGLTKAEQREWRALQRETAAIARDIEYKESQVDVDDEGDDE